jgi:replicative DNA helicase
VSEKIGREVWAAMNASPHHTQAPLPHNMESEQSLLGAILINNEALHTVAEFLQPEHFFEPIHKDIYDIARTLITSGKVAHPVTLKVHLPAEKPKRAPTGGMTLPAASRRRVPQIPMGPLVNPPTNRSE